MFFIYNSQGNVVTAVYSDIYQGSNNANEIVLLAPFNKAVQINAYISVPVLGPIGVKPMSVLDTMPSVLQDKSGNTFNAWYLKLDESVTTYDGPVQCQFKVSTGSCTLATFTSSFEVQAGVVTEIPTIPNDSELYDTLLNTLTTILYKTNNALDKSISYIKYVTNDKFLLNSDVENLVGVPTNDSLDDNSTFTKEGMTQFVTEAQIEDPTGSGNDEDFFIKAASGVSVSPFGFVADLGANKHIGIVQIYAWGFEQRTEISLYISEDGTFAEVADDSITIEPMSSNILDIIQLYGENKEARYIKIVSDSSDIIIKGVEIYQSNVDGSFEVKRGNGNVEYIAAPDPELIKDYADSAKQSAEESADYLTELESKAGKVGGYPVLANIDGQPKIPSVYINQVDVHNTIVIDNATELDNAPAQQYDLALVVVDVDGQQTVNGSYILLSGGNNNLLDPNKIAGGTVAVNENGFSATATDNEIKIFVRLPLGTYTFYPGTISKPYTVQMGYGSTLTDLILENDKATFEVTQPATVIYITVTGLTEGETVTFEETQLVSGEPVEEPEYAPYETRTWATYGTTYAASSGTAEFANNARNADTVGVNNLTLRGVLTESEYADIPALEKDSNTIFFVEV